MKTHDAQCEFLQIREQRTAVISDWIQSVKNTKNIDLGGCRYAFLDLSFFGLESLSSNNYRGTKIKLTGMQSSSHRNHRKELDSEVLGRVLDVWTLDKIKIQNSRRKYFSREFEYRRTSMDNHRHSSKNLRIVLSKYVMLLRISTIAHRLKKEKYMMRRVLWQ